MSISIEKEISVLNEYSIQRYMPHEKFQRMLANKGLYLARLDSFDGDPTEGHRKYFGEKEEKIIDALNVQLPPSLKISYAHAKVLAKEYMESETLNYYIQSWYRSEEINQRMWFEYAKYNENKNCILIVSDIFKLSEAIKNYAIPGLTDKRIKYIEDKLEEYYGVFTKTKELFEHESEHRLALDLSELISFNPDMLVECDWLSRSLPASDDLRMHRRNRGYVESAQFEYVSEKGILLKTDITKLISAVCVPADSTLEFRNNLNRDLLLNGFDIECTPIQISFEAVE